jgi:hypothetical protein
MVAHKMHTCISRRVSSNHSVRASHMRLMGIRILPPDIRVKPGLNLTSYRQGLSRSPRQHKNVQPNNKMAFIRTATYRDRWLQSQLALALLLGL